jgi:hypothetical protein
MNDAKSFSLGKREFFQLALSLVGLGLAVRRTWQLILGMNRAGGPLA